MFTLLPEGISFTILNGNVQNNEHFTKGIEIMVCIYYYSHLSIVRLLDLQMKESVLTALIPFLCFTTFPITIRIH